MEKKVTPEMIEKLKNARSAAEISRIIGLGDADVQKLSLDDLDGVSGGGHTYTDSTGHTMYVSLLDEGYVQGTDPWLDKACILEALAAAGMPVAHIIDFACEIFPAARSDVEKALKTGGTAYLADCINGRHGYHFSPE